MCCPIKARRFRTATYGWVLAVISWILAMGTSTQAMIYRRTRHYAHNSTYISLFRNYMCNHQAWLVILPKILTSRKLSISRNSCIFRKIRLNDSSWFMNTLGITEKFDSSKALNLPKNLTVRKLSISRKTSSSRNFWLECIEFLTSSKNGDNCEDLLAAPDPEVYFEFDMCVWDFKSEGQSQNFLITKTICGFIVPFIIISVSYILIAFRILAQTTFTTSIMWPRMTLNTLNHPKRLAMALIDPLDLN